MTFNYKDYILFVSEQRRRTPGGIMGELSLTNHVHRYIIEKNRCVDHFEFMTSPYREKNTAAMKLDDKCAY